MFSIKSLEERNQKIIDAIVKKANRDCPGTLALIAIYGSFSTGDIHEKSDLDLLILINDDRGWQLSSCFIQDDLQVGHDIYCTTWESLEKDADYPHPNIAKLLDSKIAYCADECYRARLEQLRNKAQVILNAPFSEEDFSKAEGYFKNAEHYYTLAMISDDLQKVHANAGGVIYFLENAIALLNKQYFRLGVKCAYKELDAMEQKPEELCKKIDSVLSATSVEDTKHALTTLMKATVDTFRKAKEQVAPPKAPVTAENITGTYEEMFSNWRNKMYVANARNDKHLAFMSLTSLQAMFSEIKGDTNIGDYNAFTCYDPSNLTKTAEAYDALLENYLQEYKKANLNVKRYPDIDVFVKDYLGE